MAYADLYADADIYMDFNNNYNYVTTAQTVTNNSFNGTPIFVADAPTNTGSTYSFKATNYANATTATPPRYVFADMPFYSGGGRSVSFWYKYTKAGGGQFVYGDSLGGTTTIIDNNPSSAVADQDIIGIVGGTYDIRPAQSDRKVQWTSRQVNTSQVVQGITTNTGQKFEQDRWYHVAAVERKLPTQTIVETAIYVNGICWAYSLTNGLNGFAYAWGQSSFSGAGLSMLNSLGITTSDRYFAHYAVWKRALTKEEIRAQAWYGLSGGDYVDLVNSDSPLYFTTLENVDKATDATVYGATSWGPLNDSHTGVFVNELGYPTGKSWRITDSGTGAENFADSSNADFVDGMNTAIRSGEYSYEFWFKQSGKPAATKTMLQSNGGTAGAGQQSFNLGSNGRIEFRSSYKSSATAYVSGSVASTYSVGNAESALFPGDNSTSVNGYADGQWHHVVYTQSNTQGLNGAGSFYGQVYVDGFMVGNRTWTNTYGWLDLNEIPASAFFSIGANQTAFPDMSFDNIAIYSRRLTDEEIAEHFIAGKTYIVPSTRTVKYWDGTQWSNSIGQKVWNGTAWIEWDASRYDGTNWVTI